MKWLKNLESIATNHSGGTCPYCGSHDTDFGFEIDVPKTQMGHGAVWCNSCKKAYHISRAEVKENDVKPIPAGLVYT